MYKTKTHISILFTLCLCVTLGITSASAATTGSGTAGFLDSVSNTNSNPLGSGIDLLSPSKEVLHSAAQNIESKLSVFNVTQNKDASQGGNKPGDEIKVTATVKNMGPGDLVSYVAQVFGENLFKVSQIQDPGTGGVLRGSTSMVYDSINQLINCNCSDDFFFTTKLNENICTDFSSIAASGIVVTFENKTQTVPVVCEVVQPVTIENPVTTEPLKPTVKKPVVTSTGPEHALLIFALLSIGGVWFWRKKVIH